MSSNSKLPTSTLRFSDVLRVGSSGPRARKSRTALSALGVSIGIAALVGVLGLSESSRSDLLDELSALGTNLLTVQAGQGIGGGDGALPETAAVSVERLSTVEVVSEVVQVDETVRRSEFVDESITGGISVVATDADLVDTLNGAVVDGVGLDGYEDSPYPVAVVGSVAAERLGVSDLDNPRYVHIGGHDVQVVGILDEFTLAADLDRAVMIPIGAAVATYDAEPAPSTLYVRVEDGAIDETRSQIPGTADPRTPRR